MRRRVMLLVSKFDHCLADIVYRWRTGELPMDIVAIVSNHPRVTFRHLDFGNIPFHDMPSSREEKATQEATLSALIDETHAEMLVLAR